jgi:hypothetical protein
MNRELPRKKLIITGVLALLLVFTTVGPVRTVVFENAVFTAMDKDAEVIVKQSFNRAVATYALARLVNAGISVLQGTEVNLEPGGVGVTLTPGQALDPVNDLVERFSWIMLASMISLGIQGALIKISPWVSIQLLLTLSLLLLLTHLWLGDRFRINLGLWGRYLLAAAIVVRFCVPGVTMLNHMAYNKFLDQDYVEASGKIKEGQMELDGLMPQLSNAGPGESELEQLEDNSGILDRTKQLLISAKAAVSPAKWKAELARKYKKAKALGAGFIERFIALAVVFVLNTIVLPLIFLWAILFTFRAVTGSNMVMRLESGLRERIVGSDGESTRNADNRTQNTEVAHSGEEDA